MPFQSTSQQRWAFGTGQPFAKRWAKQTNFKRLPYKKVKKDIVSATPTAVSPTGPGGLMSAPGMGGVRKRKKAFTIQQLEAFVTSPHYDPDTAAAIADGIPELPRLKGEQIAPGITRIHGNLCNVHGKYGRCPGSAVTPPKVTLHRNRKPRKGAKPKTPRLTPEQKRMARITEHAQNRQKVLSGLGIAADGQSALGDLADGEQPRDPSAIERGGLVAAGLVEQAKDGSYRLSASGRAAMSAAASGDAGRTGAIISAARDRTTARGERTAASTARHEAATARHDAAAAARLARQQAAQAKRAARTPRKAASGGGGKTPAPKAPAHGPTIPTPRHHGGTVSSGSSPSVTSGGAPKAPKPPAPPKPAKTPAPAKQIAPALQTAAQTLSDGKTLSDSDSMALIRNGLAHLVKGQLVLTGAGRNATMKAAPTPGDYLIVEDPAKSTTWHLQVKRNGTPDHGLMGAAWAALHGGYRGNVYAGPNKGAALSKLRALYAAEKMPLPAEKAVTSFRVFKDAAGRPRWVAQSSTAYQDRDQEIVSTKALADDCAFADEHQSYGPLRWWHTPGLDLGDCDFNAMHGKVLIESGTFRSPAIAQKVAAAADALEISLGFLHLPSEPDASGVFHHIRKFERSLVPRGKASNRFTAFRVKESPMFDPTKVAALKTLGFSDADITSLQTQAEATEKAADAEQVAFKADEPIPPPPAIQWDGSAWVLVEAEKAFPPKAVAAAAPVEGSPEEEAAESPAEEQAEMDAGEGDQGDAGGLTLSPEDIQAIGQAVSDALTTALGPLVSTMDLTNKIGSHMDELKGMMGGYTAKKDSSDTEKAEQIAALKAQQDATQAKLDELLGLQPATPARATTAPQTALNPFNPADNALLASVKDQIPADQQMFTNGFEDLAKNLFGR